MRQEELIERYGNPVLGSVEAGSLRGWCVPDPIWMSEHLMEDFVRDKFLFLHRKLVPLVVDVIEETWDSREKEEQKLSCSLKEIYGWSPRHKMRDPNRGLSLHAWGLAIDINWTDNPVGARGHTLPIAFVHGMKDAGFIWGGDWSIRGDWHHFEWGRHDY